MATLLARRSARRTKEFVSRNASSPSTSRSSMGTMQCWVSCMCLRPIPRTQASQRRPTRQIGREAAAPFTQPSCGDTAFAHRRQPFASRRRARRYLRDWSRISSSRSALDSSPVRGGSADFYPRFGPTSEWDTAAAQAAWRRRGRVLQTDGAAALQRQGGSANRTSWYPAIRRAIGSTSCRYATIYCRKRPIPFDGAVKRRDFCR